MKGPAKRAERPDETDERILAVSLAEFRKRGYYKANLDDVAGRLGLGKGTIYRHFKNKSVLFAAVVFQVMKQASGRIAGALEEKSFDARLEAYLGILSSIAREGAFLKGLAPEAARDIFLREKAFPAEGGVLLDRMNSLRSDLIRVLTVILKQGMAEGRVAKDCRPELSAEFVASLVHAFCSGRVRKDAFQTSPETKCLHLFIRRALGCAPRVRNRGKKEKHS